MRSKLITGKPTNSFDAQSVDLLLLFCQEQEYDGLVILGIREGLDLVEVMSANLNTREVMGSLAMAQSQVMATLFEGECEGEDEEEGSL